MVSVCHTLLIFISLRATCASYLWSNYHRFTCITLKQVNILKHHSKILFVVTMCPFCGATGTPCFGLRLTPLMGFKARVDVPSPALNVTCALWILGVNSDFPSQGLVSILHLGMVRLPQEWPPNVTSGTAGRFEPTNSWLKAHAKILLL